MDNKKELTVKELIRRFNDLRKLGIVGERPQIVAELKRSGTVKKGFAYPIGRDPIRLEGAEVSIGNGGTRITVFSYDGKTVEDTFGGNTFIEGVIMK